MKITKYVSMALLMLSSLNLNSMQKQDCQESQERIYQPYSLKTLALKVVHLIELNHMPEEGFESLPLDLIPLVKGIKEIEDCCAFLISINNNADFYQMVKEVKGRFYKLVDSKPDYLEVFFLIIKDLKSISHLKKVAFIKDELVMQLLTKDLCARDSLLKIFEQAFLSDCTDEVLKLLNDKIQITKEELECLLMRNMLFEFFLIARHPDLEERVTRKFAYIIELIKNLGLDLQEVVNKKDAYNHTLLMFAAKAFCLGSVRLLLDNQANVKERNWLGQDALEVAELAACSIECSENEELEEIYNKYSCKAQEIISLLEKL